MYKVRIDTNMQALLTSVVYCITKTDHCLSVDVYDVTSI
jgi:hypothetical protein